MSHLTKEAIYDVLKTIQHPSTGKSLIEEGMISSLVIRGGQVGFALEIHPNEVSIMEPVRLACEKAVANLAGVEKVTVVLTAHRGQLVAKPAHQTQGRTISQMREERKRPERQVIAGVRKVIVVASGKGGVGKSTVTVNLAAAFKAKGLEVGIADADIFGPSIPMMLGVSEKPEISDQNKMIPLCSHGIYSMSMGYLVAPESATIWRGPMVTKALYQLLGGTDWAHALNKPEALAEREAAGDRGEVPHHKKMLDILLVDTPPGTGDVHLSLAEYFCINGAIIVTTPQDVAVADAQKAADMFQKLNVPILGVVENMSWFDAGNGSKINIFGEGGGARMAEKNGVPLLGIIPLIEKIGRNSDQGVLLGAERGEAAACFGEVVEKISCI